MSLSHTLLRPTPAPSAAPEDGYISDDGAGYYVSEDGTQYYQQEQSGLSVRPVSQPIEEPT